MTTEAWQRVQEIFDRVVAVPPAARAALLDKACGQDASLRAEVASLLEHDTRAGDDFLVSPVIALRPDDNAPPAWAQQLIGQKLGRYTVVRLLGHGGMGCVFEAQQDQPARAVALKVLQPGFSAPSALARFRLEPEVLGRLQHPNIAQVYEAGLHEGRQGALPYFAMEYIRDAEPLIAHANARDLALRQRLELFAKVCDAVHHGHQKGIIHRDLKPANILVGPDGEPKVIDFGVARASDADIVMTTQCTHVGDLVGTVHYMSPEQCDGDPAAIDTRSDVYSLGVVLYELLTGTTPYDTAGTTLYHAIRVIRDEPAHRPSAYNRALRGDVDVVLLKALEKDRGRRYASVAEFVDDLRCIITHRPIRARSPSLVYLLGKFVRRNRWKTGAVAAVVIGAIATVAALVAANTSAAERRLRERAEIARYGASIGAAETALQLKDSGLARFILDDPSHADSRGWEWRHLRPRVDQSQRVIAKDLGDISCAAIDPSGRVVAVTIPTASGIKALVFRIDQEPSVPEELGPFQGNHVTPSLSRGGTRIALARTEPSFTEVCIYTRGSEQYQLQGRLTYTCQVNALALSPDVPLLAIVTNDGNRLELWDLSQVSSPSDVPARLCCVRGQENCHALVFSPDGRCLAAGGDDGVIDLFDVELLRRNAPAPRLAVLRGHTYYVYDVAFSPDGRWLASASIDETIRLWDIEGCITQASRDPAGTAIGPGAEIACLEGHTEGVLAVAFDPDEGFLVSGGVDRLVRVWEHNRFARLAESGFGQRDDGTRSWDTPVRDQICALRGHEHDVIRIAVSPNGELVSVSRDGSIKTWLPGAEDVPKLRGHDTSVGAVAFSPDGRYVVSAEHGTGLIVWDAERCVPVKTRHVRPNELIRDVMCWARGTRTFLAVASVAEQVADGAAVRGRVLVWEVAPDAETLGLDNQPFVLCAPAQTASSPKMERGSLDGYYSLSANCHGQRLAAAGTNGDVSVWEFGSAGQPPRLVTTFGTRGGDGSRLVFLDEHGLWLATASPFSTEPSVPSTAIHVWDVDAGSEVPGSPYLGHDEAVTDLAVDRSCGLLASASADKTIGLWRITRGRAGPKLELVDRLRGHADGVTTIAFHPVMEEHRLASGSHDRTIRLWDPNCGAEVAVLHHPCPVSDVIFDQQGERLASASVGAKGRDNVVRVWDGNADSVTPEARRQRSLFMEAHRRVINEIRDSGLRLDAARNRLSDWDPVTDWAREVRAIALERFDDFATRPDYFRENAWRVVGKPDRPANEYDQALHWAQVAATAAPEDVSAISVRGAAEYRCGLFEEAIRTLEDAKQLDSTYIPTHAFLALAHAALGALDTANTELDQARQSLKEADKSATHASDVDRLLDEAEQQIKSRGQAESRGPERARK